MSYYEDYPFTGISAIVGTDVVNIIKDMIEYRVENTRNCNGFLCHKKIYKESRFFYCKSCFTEMRDEGIVFCYGCNLLKVNCFCYQNYLNNTSYKNLSCKDEGLHSNHFEHIHRWEENNY